jgi:ubiquinone/menaquinone biosynthesis C-methylase UbiE
MNIRDLRRHWEKLGEQDPLWAVLTDDARKGRQWDADEFFATGRAEVAEVARQVVSLGLALPSGRALDFGCGVGRLTQALCDHFEAATGVDISASMIESARRYNRHGERCRYQVNTENDLKIFPDAEFSFIYSSITLQHMNHELMRGYLREFLRVLAPGGLLVFNLPSHREGDAEPARDAAGAGRTGWRGAAGRVYYRLRESMVELKHKIRYRWQLIRNRPLFEMHGLARAEVERLVQAGGGRIVDFRRDNKAPGWVSFQYIVARRSHGDS